MNSIKGIIFLSIFGILVHASDDDSDNQKQNKGKVSPYGLIPSLQVSKYIEKYTQQIESLEKKLSGRSIVKKQAISLCEPLENVADSVSCFESNLTMAAQLTNVGDDDQVEFNNLLRKVSSLYSVLAHEKDDKNTAVVSDISDENTEAKNKEQTVNQLCEKLRSISWQYRLRPISAKPGGSKRRFSLLDPDSDKGQEFLKSCGALQELDDLLEQKKSSLQAEDSASTLREKDSREIRQGSLVLKIPKALSFKYSGDAAAAASAQSNGPKAKRKDAEFINIAEYLSSSDSSGDGESCDDPDSYDL